MKYLCIVYAGGGDTAPDPLDEVAIKDACIEQDQQLFMSGQLLMASPLQGPDTSVAVRYRGGRALRTDGPYAETKEWIAGFMVIDADDIDQAVSIATEGPLEGFADMEIRPLLDEQHSTTGLDRSFLFPARR